MKSGVSREKVLLSIVFWLVVGAAASLFILLFVE